MPYRRLPETDQARYTALKMAVEQIATHRTVQNSIVQYSIFDKAQSLFNQFATALDQFHSQFSGRVDNSKQYRLAYKNTKMFITHFIKVINMSIQRGELSPDIRLFYKLPISDNRMPPLQRDRDILEIGKNIIDGEFKRIHNGGFPIYYPNINKVKLHYDVFKDFFEKNEFHKQNIQRLGAMVENLRKEIDEFLPTLWDQIEENYSSLAPEKKIHVCQKFGVVYYYRKGEQIVKNRLANLFKEIRIDESDNE